MGVYLTFAEYTAMGGIITDEIVFNDLNFSAQKIIDYYTFNRLTKDTTVPLAVKRVIRKLVEYENSLNNQVTEDGRVVSSQSNDGVSVSYVSISPVQMQTQLKGYQSATIRMYLNGETNEAGEYLLYRGLP